MPGWYWNVNKASARAEDYTYPIMPKSFLVKTAKRSHSMAQSALHETESDGKT